MQTTSRLNTFSWIFVLLSLGWACWLFNPFAYYFLNDDLIHIPLSKEGVWFQRKSFRPLADLSVRLDYLLWKTHAWGYHLTNLLLHLTNTVLVFLFSKKFYAEYLQPISTRSSAILTSVLFFVYALHSESIFWILGRSGSLGSLFFFSALIFYLYRKRGLPWFLASLVCFILGLLTYESSWVFPLFAMLVSYVDGKYKNAKQHRQLHFITSINVLFLVYLIARYQVIGEIIGLYEGAGFLNLDWTVLVANFFKLLLRAFVPPMHNSYLFITASLVFIGLVTIIFFSLRKKKPAGVNGLLLIILMFAFSLLPYLALGIDSHGVEGERYLYLPTMFACLLIVGAIQIVIPSHTKQWLCMGVIIFHLYFLTRSAHWYQTASAVTRTTIQQLNQLSHKKRLFIDSLPQQYYGALMFRMGFDEGADWLRNRGTVDSIIVLSQKKDNLYWSKPYYTAIKPAAVTLHFGQRLVMDTSQKQTYRTQQISTSFNVATDAYFRFTADTLHIIK